MAIEYFIITCAYCLLACPLIGSFEKDYKDAVILGMGLTGLMAACGLSGAAIVWAVMRVLGTT